MDLPAQLVFAAATALASMAAAWGATRVQVRSLEGRTDDLCGRLEKIETTQNNHETRLGVMDANLGYHARELEAGIARVEAELKALHRRLDEVLHRGRAN